MNTLGEIDAATLKVDKICIERDHETGDISWNFSTVQMSPGDLMLWAIFYKMMTESGYRKKLNDLEARIAALEAGNGSAI